MSKFKVGDKVRFIKYCSDECPEGFETTIVDPTLSDFVPDYGYVRVFYGSGNISGLVTADKYLELVESVDSTKPVTSDGGASSYYELEIAGHKLETHNVIEDVFGNDFDFGNNFKAMVRIWAQINGGGKAGTSIEYDLNKIIYTCEKLKERYVKTP